jgi:glycosyl transferase, family 25
MGTNIPVYVINLQKDIERWRRIETSLLALGISPIRVRAIDGPHKHELIRRLTKRDFHPLTPGQIGCALSHLGVWKRVHRRKLAAVILEDDIELSPSFGSFYFHDLPLFLQRCDIVKFEGIFNSSSSLSGPTLHNGHSTKLMLPFRPTLGTAAYALTGRGAEALLRRAAKIYSAPITVPNDHLLVDYDGHGAVYGETRPMITKQAGFASNIEPERRESNDKARIASMMHISNKFSHRLRRLIRRMPRSLAISIPRILAMIRIVLFAKFLRPAMTRKETKSNMGESG